jgi:predicted trehalose synthase
MRDIVERLRDLYEYDEDNQQTLSEAADEIERLREELYEIKLAAAGGEDAPGAANMVTAKDVEKWVIKYCEEIDRLREALRTIADGDTPREHAIVYRSDGVHSKHDKCKHGAWMYDGCEDCVTEYARAALGEEKE